MSVTDPIADMLTRIRNAVMVGQTLVAMPGSSIKAEIAKILKEEGYIEGYDVVDGERPEQPVLRLRLKYIGERRQRQPVITGLVRISRPGRRVYTRKRGHPVGVGWNWHCDPINPERCDDRPARSPGGCWW